MVKNLVPRYLTELLLKIFSERTHFRLRSRENLTQLRYRTSMFQKSFFPSAITCWNSLDLDVRNSVSLPTFKAKTRSTLFPHTYNRLVDYSFTRHASIDHTRLRLGFSCISSWLHSVFIIVEITVKTFRAIYIAKWHVFHASCVKVSVGAFSVGTRKHGPIWH